VWHRGPGPVPQTGKEPSQKKTGGMKGERGETLESLGERQTFGAFSARALDAMKTFWRSNYLKTMKKKGGD